MQRAIDETQRRRDPADWNTTTSTASRRKRCGRPSAAASRSEIAAHKFVQEAAGQKADNYVTQEYLEELHGEMLAAAANLEFERAAQLRDRIAELKGQPTGAPGEEGTGAEEAVVDAG